MTKMINRREFLKIAGAAGAGALLATKFRYVTRVLAATQGPGLSDPATQPKFVNLVPDALMPAFKYVPDSSNKNKDAYTIGVGQSTMWTGLMKDGSPAFTTIWGYGQNDSYTWPGKTFEVNSGIKTEVRWMNNLVDANGIPLPYLITGKDNTAVPDGSGGTINFGDFTGRPVYDPNLHWAYSLHGYQTFSIENNGLPIVVHLHGGHTDYQFDGNPEYFFSPGFGVIGPRWMDEKYSYRNDQPAGNLWYHDHALGITRLNVYAGMAGFYFVRDNLDTGKVGNPLGLPAWPYEKAYAIQDRMFKDNGELFYPAFPGDPFYVDFITGEGAVLPPAKFPGGGPTALAEFFGDHIVVNGMIWPKEEVEPRNYRLHLLNGTDSRFMAIEFYEVPLGATDFTEILAGPLDFTVVGSDQGLASTPTTTTLLLSEPGSRYDIVFNFDLNGNGQPTDTRILMKNIGGDEPFGGTLVTEEPALQVFGETDRIMAFDIVKPFGYFDNTAPEVTPMVGYTTPIVPGTVTRARKVALFEGKDEFGRLQPLLGTAEPAADYKGKPINWPDTPEYLSVGLVGQMEGSIAWHSPTTENPDLNSTEEWEIWNMTGDAHPVHLHLVHFEVLNREEIVWDSATIEDDRVLPRTEPDGTVINPNGDGTYLVIQPTVQHNSVAGDLTTFGNGFKIMNHTTTGAILLPQAGYVENTPKDMVTALPGQVTRIKASFDKPGRYVWHCHILSHEDHEMMRVLHVGKGA